MHYGSLKNKYFLLFMFHKRLQSLAGFMLSEEREKERIKFMFETAHVRISYNEELWFARNLIKNQKFKVLKEKREQDSV